jgi:hypothetical protein
VSSLLDIFGELSSFFLAHALADAILAEELLTTQRYVEEVR